MEFANWFRDPIHGVIGVTACEERVLTLPLLNRLREIRQLGLAYIAFPGGTHTRFEHSLGTMHVACLMGQALGVDDDSLQHLRLAALLHDVGHPPFSHTIESWFDMYKDELTEQGIERKRHEDLTVAKINTDNKLRSVIDTCLEVKSELISSLAVGKLEDPNQPEKANRLNRILCGPIDADKIDYILRDNFHCGFPVAVDTDRVGYILTRAPKYGFVLHGEGKLFAEQLLIARHHLITTIHHNKRNRVGNYLMAVAIQRAVAGEKAKLDEFMDVYENGNDSRLLSFLEKNAPDWYARLKALVEGSTEEGIFQELASFDFPALPPHVRYSAASRCASSDRFLLPKISRDLGDKTGTEIYVDTYQAGLPELEVYVREGNVERNIAAEDPLIKGIVKSSVSSTTIALYGFGLPDISNNKLGEIIKEFQSLDDSLTDKKVSDFSPTFGGRPQFCLFLLCQLSMHKLVQEHRRTSGLRKTDLLLLVLRALERAFEEELGREHTYVDGVTALGETLSLLEKHWASGTGGGGVPPQDQKYEIRRSGRREMRGLDIPQELYTDLDKLEKFGLVYRLIRPRLMGKGNFAEMQLIRPSSWAYRFYEKELSLVDRAKNLQDISLEFFKTQVKKHANMYQDYFRLSASRDPLDRRRAKELRKGLPFKIA